MYDRILKMIDFVENKAPLGRNGITLMRELLCFIRMNMRRTMTSISRTFDDNNLSSLRQFAEEQNSAPVPKDSVPDWCLINLLRLRDDFMTKWLADTRID